MLNLKNTRQGRKTSISTFPSALQTSGKQMRSTAKSLFQIWGQLFYLPDQLKGKKTNPKPTMYHFSVCSSIKLLPYGIWTLTSNLQQLISSSKNFLQKEVIQNSKKRLWMSYKWNIRLRLMPAGSFFQTNGLFWKHFVFYLEMISLGYLLQFWYSISIKQELSHSQRLKTIYSSIKTH